MWAAVFGALRWISLLQILRTLSTRLPRSSTLRRTAESYWFVEAWALGHLVLALVAVVSATLWPTSTISIVLALYGLVRSFEIVITQLNILLFDEYRARRAGRPYRVRGYRRMVVLLLQNFGEIVFWFAASYAVIGGAELLPHNATVGGLIRESFLTTVSFGSSAPEVVGSGGLALIAWQGLVGLLVTLLSLARFIGLLPRPASMDVDDI